MKRNIAIISLVFLLGFAVNSNADFLQGSVGWDGSYTAPVHLSTNGDNNWVTHYYFDVLNGPRLIAFCVDLANATSALTTYELLGLTGMRQQQAAYIAGNYQTLGLTQTEAQVAIWNLWLDDDNTVSTTGGGKVYVTNSNSSIIDHVNSVLGALPTTYDSGWVVAHLPNSYNPNNFQDFLINPVPEPATMMLLGLGLIGLAGFGRKKLA